MLPDPIHPAIVHFPIVLAALLPLMAIGALILARRGTPIRTLWTGVAATAALLAGSAWLAVETGEAQEERVETVVSEAPLDTHQDRATLFLYMAAGTLVVAAAGLARGRAGQVGRVAATVAALAMLPAGYFVGHSGGELVYKYGAAQAYAPASTAQVETGQAGEPGGNPAGHDDDDDR
ncbi:MAG TPA: DUF2231 domain-containing protein [Gemmatimonadales bacterium]